MTSVNLKDMYDKYKQDDVLAPVPEGTYDLEVTSAKASNNGVTPVFRVLSGPEAGKKVLAGTFTLTDKSRSIFFQNMTGFGLNETDFAGFGTFDDLANALVGRKVQVELKIEQWNNQDRNKIPIGRIKLIDAGAPAVAAPAPVAVPVDTPPPVAATPIPEAAAPPPPPPPVPEAAAPPAATSLQINVDDPGF